MAETPQNSDGAGAPQGDKYMVQKIAVLVVLAIAAIVLFIKFQNDEKRKREIQTLKPFSEAVQPGGDAAAPEGAAAPAEAPAEAPADAAPSN